MLVSATLDPDKDPLVNNVHPPPLAGAAHFKPVAVAESATKVHQGDYSEAGNNRVRNCYSSIVPTIGS